jgi:hypothetical protein
MPAPYHPLNQAVLIQALHDLRNGQLRRCLAMGFGEQELELLKRPDLAALLIHARVSWCQVTVDRQTLQRLAEQAIDDQREAGAVDRLLRLGASSEMICQRYGLTHQEVALRRDILGLPRRKGRFPTLDNSQERALWRDWQAVAGRDIALDDEDALLEWAAERAESMDVSLTVVWTILQNWIAQEIAQAIVEK